MGAVSGSIMPWDIVEEDVLQEELGGSQRSLKFLFVVKPENNMKSLLSVFLPRVWAEKRLGSSEQKIAVGIESQMDKEKKSLG